MTKPRWLRWHGPLLVKGDYLRTGSTGRLSLVVNAGRTGKPQAVVVLPVAKNHQPEPSARVFVTRRGR